MLESLFNKVAGLAQFLTTFILENIRERLLLEKARSVVVSRGNQRDINTSTKKNKKKKQQQQQQQPNLQDISANNHLY